MAIKSNNKNPMAKDLFTKKYKPKIVDGKATSVEGVLHRFTFIMAKDD